MAFVVFVRGINVGGHRRFRPSLLANTLQQYGVINIGAAGTFVVLKQISQSRLRAELLRHLPFAANVMICPIDELLLAVSKHPFHEATLPPGIVRFVSVSAKPCSSIPDLPVQIPDGGRWMVKIVSQNGRFIFGFYRREMKAIGCLASIDKLVGSPVTTRQWSTVSTILRRIETSRK